MATGKKYYWLKLDKDFFKRHDIKIVEAMPNGKDYILFYLKLLCESTSHEGNLRFSETIPYNIDMLSVVTGTNIDVVEKAIKIFTELGMMSTLDDGTIYMNELNKMLGYETDWAKKKREQRTNLLNGESAEIVHLPNGEVRYVDEKRYGGNGKQALLRAKGKCEICGSEDNVVIHHKNGYSNKLEDLICLCSKCHGKEHSYENRENVPFMSPLCPPDVRQEKEIDIEIDKKKEIYKERKRENFVKPTLDEVVSYCKERKNNIDPEVFYDFYEAKNWMIGKNKMKDWKACVRTWEKTKNYFSQKPVFTKNVKETADWFDEYEQNLKQSVENEKSQSNDHQMDVYELGKKLWGDTK